MLQKGILGAMALGCALSSSAQDGENDDGVYELAAFSVTAEREAFIDGLNLGLSVSELKAADLGVGGAGSLGEIFKNLPGIGSSSFGPAVGRPVVRGLSGKRVRILADGLGTGDASAVSPDHAVALDPRLLRSVRILRGAASLFYGNTAIGGAIDVETRILPAGLESEFEGVFETTYQSATQGWDAWLGGEMKAGSGFVAFNALIRDHEDLEIPGLARREDVVIGHSHGNSDFTTEPNPFGLLPNTSQESETYTLGWKQGFGEQVFSAGLVAHLITYGVPFHSHSDVTETEVREVDDVFIELEQYRALAEFERRFEKGFLDAIHLRASATNYLHDEVENGTVESSFDIRSEEIVLEGFRRLDGEHPLEYAVGVSAAREDFSSSSVTNLSGAIFPATETLNGATYAVVKKEYGRWSTTLAGRIESHRRSLVDFDAFSRSYTTPTVAVGQEVRLAEGVLIAFSHTRMERAPNANELFANGGHLATGLFERGSLFQFPSQWLDTERGSQSEVGLSLHGKWGSLQANAFYLDFDRFVFLRRSAFTDTTTGLPVFDYIQRPAELQGGELTLRLNGRSIGFDNWQLYAAFDTLRGRFRRAGDGASIPLPRMAPQSALLELIYRAEAWRGLVRLKRVAAQKDVELNSETATPGYEMIDLEFKRLWNFSNYTIEASIALTNATGVEGRNHLSYLKDVAPLAGRNLVLSLHLVF